MKKKSAASRQLSFQTRIERLAEGMDYFAVSIPEKVTQELGTRGPVPVKARVNGSGEFLCSLYPVGEGRHFMRVRNKICASVKVTEGDRVRVEITVRDRSEELDIPPDVAKALRAEGALKSFESLPPGQRSFLLRKIEEAAKPETREKRIGEAIETALAKSRR